jgi:hypothetical protein
MALRLDISTLYSTVVSLTHTPSSYHVFNLAHMNRILIEGIPHLHVNI